VPRKMFFTMLVIVLLASGCAAPTPMPVIQKIWTVENAGLICFRNYNLSTRELGGIFRPKGCFSSSCTVPQAQKVDVQLVHSQGALKFVTRFILLDTMVRTPGAPACTADCDGGGEVPFKFADVMTGTYTVILGNREMGSLGVPPTFTEAAGICFGELH